MEETTGVVTDTKKLKAKELVMFIFACAILITSCVLGALPSGIEYNEDARIDGFTILAVAIASLGYVLIKSANLIFCWIIGLTISVKLAFRRKLIPRWMHIISLLLTLIYSVLIIMLAIPCILILIAFN